MSALSTEQAAGGGDVTGQAGETALAAIMDGLSEATIAALGSPHQLLIGDGWRPASTDSHRAGLRALDRRGHDPVGQRLRRRRG